MGPFKITEKTTVAEFKELFCNEVGGTLRIYDGRSEAPDDVTLVSLGANERTLKFKEWGIVYAFEKGFEIQLNLKVKVYTKDNSVKVHDLVPLMCVNKLPVGITEAMMEDYFFPKKENKKVTKEWLEEVKDSMSIIVALRKLECNSLEELKENMYDDDGEWRYSLGFVCKRGRKQGRDIWSLIYQFDDSNNGLPFLYDDEEGDIDLSEVYVIDGEVDGDFPEQFIDPSTVGTYFSKHLCDFLSMKQECGEWPDEENGDVEILAAMLTESRHPNVWEDVQFPGKVYFIYNGEIVEER